MCKLVLLVSAKEFAVRSTLGPEYRQVTPESAPALLCLLQHLGAVLGPVKVSASSSLGFVPDGEVDIVFTLRKYSGALLIECAHGCAVMPIPVMPLGFVPQEEGDCVAYYRINGGTVSFKYWTFGADDYAERTFTFSV